MTGRGGDWMKDGLAMAVLMEIRIRGLGIAQTSRTAKIGLIGQNHSDRFSEYGRQAQQFGIVEKFTWFGGTTP